jgi:hypothetical protein
MTTRRNFIKQSSLMTSALLCYGPKLLYAADDESFDYQSKFIKVGLDKKHLRFNFFSSDSLGKSNFSVSPLFALKDQLQTYTTKQTRKSLAYYIPAKDDVPVWKFRFSEREIELRSRFAGQENGESFLVSFSQKLNHCTALGYFSGDHKLKFPCVLHFPGMGTFRVYCSDPDGHLSYNAELTDKPFVNISFPAANKVNPDVTYVLKSVAIFPDHSKILRHDDRYDGFKKNFINIFQLSPGFKLLANNSTSDACAFTLFLYAEMAKKTPQLVEGLSAFDLIRTTLDKYLNGFVAYGMVGKPNWHSKYNSSDSFPSLIMAACYYILHTKDYKWAKENYQKICDWANKMIATDKNGDGIIEYGYSGNSNSWNGDIRPANWWDTIGFGHDDAYSNALAYRACVLLGDVSNAIGNATNANYFTSFAQKLKTNYWSNFYNEKSGVLAGWKSEDGKLHDYYFTFVNSIAICYGLLTEEQGKKVMTRLIAKMEEVGYTDFSLGLPGNLIPIRREDYIHFDRRWGYGKDDEGRDGFQIYENGGATGCYAYYTIKALNLMGMQKEADAILNPMLESFTKGEFEGNCPGSTMTKDWKTWKGECWGYEGFLVDNYLTLLAVVDE